jgi:hypothetical protein
MDKRLNSTGWLYGIAIVLVVIVVAIPLIYSKIRGKNERVFHSGSHSRTR